MIAFERVGAAQGDRAIAQLAVAAEFGARDTIGLGLGAAGGQVDGNGLALRRVRHVDTSRRRQHTLAPMSRMSQMDYEMILFQTRGPP